MVLLTAVVCAYCGEIKKINDKAELEEYARNVEKRQAEQRREEIIAEVKSMSLEKYIEEAGKECYEYLDTNDDYCDCYKIKLREMTTERSKELFIADRLVLWLGIYGEDTLGEKGRTENSAAWQASADYKEFMEYRKIISKYCEKYYDDQSAIKY
jgi:hypothetical protein